MSPTNPDREPEVRRLAEASVWQVRLSEADLESSAEFEAWLALHPDNPAAWARVHSAWAHTGESATRPEIMAARRDALNRARRAGRRDWWGRHPVWTLGSAAAVAVIGLAGALLWQRNVQELHYRTALGERTELTLPDGSQAKLDAGTEVDVRYSRRARQIRLLKGQARFEVAHNPARPFRVEAGGETVVAVGTDFNVNLVGPKILVTLIEGRVNVVPVDPDRGPAVVLLPGQQLVASPSEPTHVESVSIASATAWEAGLLVFHNEPLGSVVSIISRYVEHPVTADSDVSGLRMSGVFKEGDVATFADVIVHYLPVSASAAPDGTIALHRKP
jgi:transmembrane sensor